MKILTVISILVLCLVTTAGADPLPASHSLRTQLEHSKAEKNREMQIHLQEAQLLKTTQEKSQKIKLLVAKPNIPAFRPSQLSLPGLAFSKIFESKPSIRRVLWEDNAQAAQLTTEERK